MDCGCRDGVVRCASVDFCCNRKKCVRADERVRRKIGTRRMSSVGAGMLEKKSVRFTSFVLRSSPGGERIGVMRVHIGETTHPPHIHQTLWEIYNTVVRRMGETFSSLSFHPICSGRPSPLVKQHLGQMSRPQILAIRTFVNRIRGMHLRVAQSAGH